jgi:NACHT N-terminal Helical domain 1/NACHT domain
MPLTFATAAATIGTPIAEFLLKRFLGEFGAAAGKGLLDIAATAIADEADRRTAKRQFEELGDRIVKRVRPLFDKVTDNSAAAIAAELGTTLGQSLSAAFLIEKDLDPARLAAAFRQARPLPHAMFGADEAALYERTLDQTVRYLVGIAHELPRFEPTAVAAVLGRLSRMGDDLEKVADGIARIERDVSAGKDEAAARTDRFEADYRQAVARNLDYLELFGADVGDEARRHRLSVGYVSLTVSASEGAESSGTVSAEDIFLTLSARSGRLLIRGEAGSGKSTLLRWLAIQTAAARGGVSSTPGLWHFGALRLPVPPPFLPSIESSASSEDITPMPGRTIRNPEFVRAARRFRTSTPLTFTSGAVADLLSWKTLPISPPLDRIPFLVRLRDCREGRPPRPENLPGQIANELGRPPEAWVRSVLDGGRGLLLLDGVDEVPNSRREDIHAGIRAIAGQYGKCWIVATTRPTAVRPGWLRADNFAETEINPLSETDRADLVRRWQDAVAEALALQGRPEDLAAPCRGTHPGRTASDQITVFKALGTALSDLAAARLAVDRRSHPRLPSEGCGRGASGSFPSSIPKLRMILPNRTSFPPTPRDSNARICWRPSTADLACAS